MDVAASGHLIAQVFCQIWQADQVIVPQLPGFNQPLDAVKLPSNLHLGDIRRFFHADAGECFHYH